jgi:hypothetical protein
MSQIPELAQAVLFFMPGFLFVQILYLGGIGRRRSDFDQAVWSVIVSVVIRWLAVILFGRVDLGIRSGLDMEMAVLGLAVTGGVILGLLRGAVVFVFVMEEEEEASEKY